MSREMICRLGKGVIIKNTQVMSGVCECVCLWVVHEKCVPIWLFIQLVKNVLPLSNKKKQITLRLNLFYKEARAITAGKHQHSKPHKNTDTHTQSKSLHTNQNHDCNNRFKYQCIWHLMQWRIRVRCFVMHQQHRRGNVMAETLEWDCPK